MICGGLLCLFSHFSAKGQEVQLSVYTIRNLSFGAFFQGNAGGTVTVSHDGSRSVTGDIIPANMGFLFYPAIFEVEAAPGTLISILNGADATLTGSNGGSITLRIGESDLGTPFNTTATPPARTQVTIGATLTVGTPQANPSGSYSGTYSVTFINE